MRVFWLSLVLISAVSLFTPASADEPKLGRILQSEAGHRLLIEANNLHDINKFLTYLINYKSLEDRVVFIHDKQRLGRLGLAYETHHAEVYGEFRHSGFADVFHLTPKADCSENRIEQYYKEHLSSDYISGLSVSGALKLKFTRKHHNNHLETLDDSELAIKLYPEEMKADIFQFGCKAHVNQRSIYGFLSDVIVTCQCISISDFDKIYRQAYLEDGVITDSPFLRNALPYYVLHSNFSRHSIADKHIIFIFDNGPFSEMKHSNFSQIDHPYITIHKPD